MTESFKGEALALALNILERKVMKRALIIYPPFIKDLKQKSETEIGLNFLKDECENNEEDIQKKVAAVSNVIKPKEEKEIIPDNIIIDVPDTLKMKESLDTIILETEDPTARKIKIGNISPLESWKDNYNNMKWRIDIFSYPESQETVNKASRKILLDTLYEIDVLESASTLCKIELPL